MYPYKPFKEKELLDFLQENRGIERIAWTEHARQRLEERGIIMSDVLYLLRHDFELLRIDDTTRSDEGLFKYKIAGYTPNSNNKRICLVIIPSLKTYSVKIVTVMWEKENES